MNKTPLTDPDLIKLFGFFHSLTAASFAIYYLNIHSAILLSYLFWRQFNRLHKDFQINKRHYGKLWGAYFVSALSYPHSHHHKRTRSFRLTLPFSPGSNVDVHYSVQHAFVAPRSCLKNHQQFGGQKHLCESWPWVHYFPSFSLGSLLYCTFYYGLPILFEVHQGKESNRGAREERLSATYSIATYSSHRRPFYG